MLALNSLSFIRSVMDDLVVESIAPSISAWDEHDPSRDFRTTLRPAAVVSSSGATIQKKIRTTSRATPSPSLTRRPLPSPLRLDAAADSIADRQAERSPLRHAPRAGTPSGANEGGAVLRAVEPSPSFNNPIKVAVRAESFDRAALAKTPGQGKHRRTRREVCACPAAN
jgi:hypothetical protein